jgi:hypothetical protein
MHQFGVKSRSIFGKLLPVLGINCSLDANIMFVAGRQCKQIKIENKKIALVFVTQQSGVEIFLMYKCPIYVIVIAAVINIKVSINIYLICPGFSSSLMASLNTEKRETERQKSHKSKAFQSLLCIVLQ